MPVDHARVQTWQTWEKDHENDLAVDVQPLPDKEEEILVPDVVC